MSQAATLTRTVQKTEHFDVLIVGAGISGVGGAYHLAKERPGTSFVVLDNRTSSAAPGPPPPCPL